MPDRRSVDDLSIEELEQILRIRKRQARQRKLDQFARVGRRRNDLPLPEDLAALADTPNASSTPSPVVPHTSFFVEAFRERRFMRDRLLLAVEITAALSLVGVLIFAALSLQELNADSAQDQADAVAELPTASPTPII